MKVLLARWKLEGKLKSSQPADVMEIFEQFIILSPSTSLRHAELRAQSVWFAAVREWFQHISQFRQSDVVAALTRQQHRYSLHHVDGVFFFRETGVVERGPSVILRNVNSWWVTCGDQFIETHRSPSNKHRFAEIALFSHESVVRTLFPMWLTYSSTQHPSYILLLCNGATLPNGSLLHTSNMRNIKRATKFDKLEVQLIRILEVLFGFRGTLLS